MSKRTELKEALYQYVSDTFIYIKRVKDFLKEKDSSTVDTKNTKNLMRENNSKVKMNEFVGILMNELKTLVKIKETTGKKKGKKSSRLEKELAASLKVILDSLNKMQHFLDAVENLAVTSVHVFQENNPVLHLTEGCHLKTVQDIITAAQIPCPQLIRFKRDNNAFFSPKKCKLQNVEVLAYQLDQYIKAVQKICGALKKSSVTDFCSDPKPVVDINEVVSEYDIKDMLSLIKNLKDLRENKDFKMVFMFEKEYCIKFITMFHKCQPRMLQFLDELEDSAVKLDRINKNAKIASVVGSFMGAVGGVLFILGVIPVTAAGAYALPLTGVGVGLGILSGLIGLATTVSEIIVKRKQHKRESKTFQKFMEDVKSLKDCLDEVIDLNSNSLDDLFPAGNELLNDCNVIGKQFKEAVTTLKDIEVCDELAKGSMALSNVAKVFIVFDFLFLGMDIFFIVSDSISLAKGSETEFGKFIRVRAALCRSEIDSWKNINDSLERGCWSFDEKQNNLKTKFYLDV